MSLHNVSYQHWEGTHHGIWRRRAVIAANGLRACLNNKWARHLVLVAWVICLLEVAVLFLIGQLLVKDSVIYLLVDQFDAQARLLVGGLVNWLTDHPEISVRTTFNILFYFFATNLRHIAMISVALVIPHLITQDLSSRAIIIYSSKAVSRFDYFLGKFGTVFGLLTLVWLAPVTMAWFAGNFMASDWTFFWHSRTALFNTLSSVVFAMVVISVVALGISALSTKPRAATGMWIMFWLIGGMVSRIGQEFKPWLQHVSISRNVDQISRKVFDLNAELALATDEIPFFGDMLREFRQGPFDIFSATDVMGSLTALGIMAALAVGIMHNRVKPE